MIIMEDYFELEKKPPSTLKSLAMKESATVAGGVRMHS